MVEDAMDHQPLHLDSITVKFLLHVDKERIFILPLGAFVFITLTAKIHRRRFVHVSLSLVVAEHHLAVQFKLRKSSREIKKGLLGLCEFIWGKCTEKSIFSTTCGSSFGECLVPEAPAPRSSASRTYCTIWQRTPSPCGPPAEGDQEHQQRGQQAVGQALVLAAPPIAMLKPSGLCPSSVDTVRK